MKTYFKKIVFVLVTFLSFTAMYAQPANDNCSTATSLGTLPTPGACTAGLQNGTAVTLNNQTTVAATGANPYVYLTACQGGGNMQAPALDVWYSFVSTGSTVNITITGFPNASIGLWSGTSCASLTGAGCMNLPAGGSGTLIVPSVQIGQTYYIQVSGGTSVATDNNFSIAVDNDIDCNDCLRTSTLTASPSPVNGTYAPGQVVHFCYTVVDFQEINVNWLHGVQITMGPGWTGAITGSVLPTACGGNPGTWAYYPTMTGSVSGQTFGEGFYFDDASVAGGPGALGNFGDPNSGGLCTPTFCWDLTVSAACVAGQDLGVTVNTTADGESGGYSNLSCQQDPANDFIAVKSSGPVMTSPTSATICSSATMNFPLTADSPSTFTWVAASNPNVTGESTTNQSSSNINNTLTNTSAVTQVVTYTVTPSSTPGGCPGTPQTVLVTVNPPATTNAGPDATICATTCTNLAGVSGVVPGVTPSTFSNSTVIAIPNNNTTGANSSVTATGAVAGATTIGSICFTIDHTKASDIGNNGNPNAITITMPDGTVYNSTLTPLSGSGVQTFCIPPAVYAGYAGTLNGTFTINIKDTRNAAGGTGNITNVTVVLNTNSISWSPTTNMTNSNTLTPNVCPTGTTTYTLTTISAGGCVATDQVIITVGPAPTASISYTTPMCKSLGAQSVTLTGTGAYTGGTYSSTAGLTINAATGAITPSTSTAGSYTVTYTIAASGGCPVVTAITTVVITAVPTAVISYAGTPFCKTIVGAQAVTLTGTGAYTGGTYSSTAGLTINAGTGAITPSSSTAGSYTVTYTIPASAGCAAVPVTTTVVITAAPTATITYATPFCTSLAAPQTVTLTGTGAYTGGSYSSTAGLNINAATGAITPSTSTAGTYTVTYTAPASAGCAAVPVTTSVTITATPTATISYAGSPFCTSLAIGQAVTLTGTGAYVGGAYTSTAGLSINAGTGAITPSTSTAGTYTVTYTIPASAGCAAVPVTTSVTITAAPTATISYATPFCKSNAVPQAVTLTGTGAYTGGTYSSTAGLTINAATGAITPSTSTAGTYTVTYTIPASAGCSAIAVTTSVTINPILTPTINCGVSTTTSVQFTWLAVAGATGYSVSYQINAGAVVPVGPIGNVLTYSVAGLSPGDNVTLTLTPTGGAGTCFSFSTQICTANNCTPPTATISYATPFCSSNGVPQLVTLTGTGAYLGGTYSSTAGLTINAVTGSITPSTSTAGSYTITYTIAAAAGCSSVTATTTVMITAVPTAAISYAGTPFCNSIAIAQAVTLTGTGAYMGGAYTSTAGLTINAATGAITPSTSTAGTYTVTYTIPASAGCSAVPVTTSVTITAVPTATITYATPFCTSNAAPQAVTLAGTGAYTGGTYSSTAGLTINTVTGAITPSTSTAGTYTITYTIPASAGCSAVPVTTSVTITAAPTATIAYAGPFCTSNAAPQTVTLAGTGAYVGGTFTSTAGLSINAASGAITPSTSTAGTYTVTYTIPASAGCAAVPVTTSVTITALPTATITYATPFCASNAAPQAVTLAGTGAYTGGTYTSTAGLSIDPTTGAITPNTSTAGTYTVTYTIPASAGCSSVPVTTSITITAVPTATITYAGPFCTSNAAPQTVALTGTGVYMGGIYTSTAGLTINAASGAITPSTSTAGTYTVTYTIPASAGCSAVPVTTSVTITAVPTATITYAAPFCTSDGAAQAVTLTGTGAYTGGTYSSAAGLTINTATGAITPSTSTAGTYTVTYTIPASAGCSAVPVTTSVTITTAPTATITYASPFCTSNAVAQAVTLTGTDAYTGGTYTSTAGLTINAATGAITPSTSAAGTYTVTYTIPASAGCSAVPVTTSVTITAAPTATISYATPFCTSNAAAQAVTLTGTGVYTGGTYTSAAGLTINAATGAITASTSTAGIYTVTYTIPASSGCSAVPVTTSVTITAAPTATISYATPFCTSNAAAQAVTLTGTGAYTGGTYSSTAGLTINAATGAITASTSTAGTYTVTYTIPASAGCSAVPVTTSVTITAAPTATISYATPFCTSNAAAQVVTLAGTGAYTGGTYSSTAGLTINAATGAITPSTSTAGTYTVTYTIPASAGCSSVPVTTSVTITAAPTATITYATPFCTSNAAAQAVTLTGTGAYTGGTYTSAAGLTINAATGAITASTSTAGTYTVTYTIPASAGCSSVPVTTSVTITAAPTATITYATPFCTSNAAAQAVTLTGTGAYTGGTYSSTAGLTINAATGAITPSTSTAGTYTVTYTIPASAGCSAVPVTTSVTITATPTATITYATPFCTSNAAAQAVTLTGTGAYTGGTYSSTAGLTINAATGAITASTSTAGTYTVTYTIPASAGCSSVPVTTSVTITAAPTATITYATPFCTSNATAQAVTLTGTGAYTGGAYSSTVGLTINAVTGDITPSTSTAGTYTVTYTIPASAGCSSVPVATSVTITAAPTATISYAGTPYCSGVGIASVTQTGTAGGTYSSTVGLVINSVTGDVNLGTSIPGLYTVNYTIAASGGCSTLVVSTSIMINTTTIPVTGFSYTTPVCGNASNQSPIQVAGFTTGGTYSSTVGLTINPSTGVITPTASTAGTYTITYTVPATICGPVGISTFNITITPVPTATITYATPFCTSNATAQAVTLTGTGAYTGGTYSSAAGLTINTATGAITPSTSTAGTYTVTYTIPASAGCSAVPVTTSVTITTAPTATITYASPFCTSNAVAQAVTLTGTDAYTGGTYTSTAGLTINAATGAITPSTSAAGTYTVTYTIPASAGCSAVPVTTSVTITAAPTATISYATPFCTSNAAAQAVTLTGTGVYTGGTYTSAAGLTINAATGAITASTSTAGIYTVTYTIPASSGCSAVPVTTSVTITAAPTATISYATPFCTSNAAAQAVTLTGTGAYTGGTYSSTAGLTINAATGAITASTSTAGTYTVTYTIPASAGCSAVPVTTSVTITAAPTATISYATPFCTSNAAAQVVTLAGTGAYTGGTYSSTAGLTINAATGAITPSTSTAGTYTVTYTIPASAGCSSVPVTTSVTITAAPTATITYATPFCTSNAAAQAVTLTGTGAYTGGTYTSAAGLTINAATGAITASTSTAGTYTVTYTIPASAGCSSVPVTTSVTITAAPTATITYATPFCTSNAAAQAVTLTGTGAYTGGTYSSTAGLTINAATGAITPSTSTAGTYTVTYTIPASAGCSAVPVTTSVTITATPTATITYATPFCTSNAAAQAVTLTGTGAYTGGTYSSTAGLTINAATGAITASTSTAGTYTVTYTIPASAGCSSVPVTTSVTITAAPTATITYATPFCTSNATAQAVTLTGTGAYTGGAYSSTVGLTINAVTGDITPSTSTAGTYTVTYTIPASAGCSSVPVTTSVTITAAPTATISYAGLPFCKSVTTQFPVTLTGTGAYTGGNFTASPNGLAINGSNGTINVTPTSSTAGTYTVTYTIPASAGCSAVVVTTTVTITATPTATIAYAAPFCTSDSTQQPVTLNGTDAYTGGTYTSTAGLSIDSATGSIVPSASTPGTYTVTYTIPASGGCPAVPVTTSVTITAAPTGTISYATPFCISDATAQAVTLTGTGAYTGGTYSSTAGLSINTATGAITPSASTAGTYTVTYTIPANSGCAAVPVTTTVVIMPAVVPAFTQVAPICAGGFLAPLPTTSNNGIVGVWSPAINNMGTTTYTFTPNSGICATTTPMTITVNPLPAAISGATLEACDPNSDGFTAFNLQSADNQIAGGSVPAGVVITYHETAIDAQNGTNPRTSPYTNIVAYTQTIYVSASNASTGCSNFTTLQLIVHNTPIATDNVSLQECDDNTDGTAIFNLTDADTDILGTLDPTQYDVTYYVLQADAQAGTNPILNVLNYSSTTQIIWVRVADKTTGCFDVVSLQLIVNPLPVVPFPVPSYSLCDYNLTGDEKEEFDLSSRMQFIIGTQTGLNVSFHRTAADALADVNALPMQFINETNAQTLHVRVENNVTQCFVVTTMDLRVEPLPTIQQPTPLELTQCDLDGNGFTSFDLDALIPGILNGAPNTTVTFHETATDADTGNNALTSPYTNITAYSHQIWIRAENTLTHCYSKLPVTLHVNASPVIPPVALQDVPKCDADSNNQNGFTSFDLTLQQALAEQSNPNYSASLYTSLANAQAGTSPIINLSNFTNTSNPQTIWIVLTDSATSCLSSIGSFQLIVNTPLALTTPTALSLCDDGATTTIPTRVFDLTVKNSEILGTATGYTVTYFPSSADALAGTNAIANPTAYTNISNAQTLGVMVTSPAGCKSFTTMDIRVLPLPTPKEDPVQLALCDDVNSPNGTELFDLTQNQGYIANGDPNLSFEYYLSPQDADAQVNMITTPTSYEIGTRIIWIRVMNNQVNSSGSKCYKLVQQSLLVNPLPVVTSQPYPLCDAAIPASNTATFDLHTMDDDLLGMTDTSNYTVTYYLTAANAQSATAPLPNMYTNITNPQDIYVRVVNNTTGCVNFNGIVTLSVKPGASATSPAAPLVTCDTDYTTPNGTYTFDLTQLATEVLGGQNPAQFTVAYFASQTDALAGTGAIATPNAYATASGTIYMVVTNTTTGCKSDPVSVGVTVEPLAEPQIASSTGGTTICVSSTNVLLSGLTLDSGVANPSNYTFQWYMGGVAIAGATGNTYPITAATPTPWEGSYTVVATSTSALGCVSLPSAPFVVVQAGPAAAQSPAYTGSAYFSDNQTITVHVDGYGIYYYSIDGGPIVNNGGVFENVSMAIGGHDILVYDVEGDCGPALPIHVDTVNYPTYFTPNGDGYHDTWNIIGFKPEDNAKIYIFDRYGKLIKQISPLGAGWDGTYNGQPLFSTDYWFTVDYNENGANKVFKAHFSLKR